VSDSIALVPARGGSKRIPRKNVRPFLGTPAVVRTIGTVLASGVADRVIVSTDDEEIAQLAKDAGAEVPGLRPEELADDHASTVAVVRHAITAWMHDADPAATLLVVYPTAVLLTHELVGRAVDRFIESDADFLIPVLRYPHPVERRLRIGDAGLLVADEPQHLSSRTQDLEPAFHDAGQFYIGRLHSWMDAGNGSPLQSARALAMELPADLAVDIDEPQHWDRAEQLAAGRMT
jgi:N-acylneuraminate cytidylyltransferase